jgi:hypothetical protein
MDFTAVGQTNLEGKRGDLHQQPVGNLGLVRNSDGTIGTPMPTMVVTPQSASQPDQPAQPDTPVTHFAPLGSAATALENKSKPGIQGTPEQTAAAQQGLTQGGSADAGAGPPAATPDNTPTQSSTLVTPSVASQPPPPPPDFRVRISALHPSDVYALDSGVNVLAQFLPTNPAPTILAPLRDTSGMLFPYTPQISFSQAVNYMDLQLVHANSDFPAYTRTPSVSVSISGKFTVQNQTEGRYALACLHFLRAVSKCYFGKQDAAKAGLPPPILLLNGYGMYMFNNLRVILKNHSWQFDDSVDSVMVTVGSGSVRLPALFSITCELTVVQTPQRMREQFSFDKFASGALMQQGGWI